MPNTELDLWPDDIGHSDLVAPVAIMRQQASFLGRKTQNLVRGNIVSTFNQSNENLVHYFFMVAPALQEYRYKLFTVRHKISFYPLFLYSERTDGKEVEVANQDEFLETLKAEFNSEKARSVIESMIAQSEK